MTKTSSKSYLFTPGEGHLRTLLAGHWLTHNLLVGGAVHGVGHLWGGGVLVVKIAHWSVFTNHLCHRHGYLKLL